MSIKFHTFRQQQWIPRPIAEVFALFSDARNLEKLTPPWLGFRILKLDPGPIHTGSQIRYRLRLHYLPVYWTTVIRSWDPPHRFVDIQTSGPYKLWHHTHRFESYNGGTKIRDVVRYALPFGILGRIVHAIKVRRDVEAIFQYRRRRIEELFPE